MVDVLIVLYGVEGLWSDRVGGVHSFMMDDLIVLPGVEAL